MRWTELISGGATILGEALLPRNSDGTALLGQKAYYSDFIPAVDMKVVPLGGMSMWESIINAPGEQSGVLGNRFGRAMTLPDPINNLGEETGSRSGMIPPHRAYISKGEGDCVLSAVISRLCGLAEVGNPDSINLGMVPWGSKMLASIEPDMKISLGRRCRCNTHLGCPAQRVHVDLPLVSAGTELFPPGMCGKESDIGLFSIIAGEHWTTIRIIRLSEGNCIS